MIVKKVLAVVMFSAFCALSAFAGPTTLTGTVTDDMCGAGKHMMPGKPAATCVRECVKSGAKYALAANGKVYILSGKASQLDALAGQKATVTGDINGNTLTVSSIAAAK